MFKSLIAGFVLGAAAAVAAVYFVPAVDQHREASIISVTPNGGNTEDFHINVPMDRILIGASGQFDPVPPGMKWPENRQFVDMRAELYKIRNARDTVIGVASRIAASSDKVGDTIEWVLHLPARGSAYILMSPQVVGGIQRSGVLRAGTREYGTLRGNLTERWVPNTSGREDAPEGRIELLTAFVSTEYAEIEERSE